MMRRLLPVSLIALAGLAFAGCATVGGGGSGQRVSFQSDIKPLLESRCMECHNSTYVAQFGGVNMETRENAMRGGYTGAIIVPGKPRESKLYQVLKKGIEMPNAMPPTPHKLTPEECDMVKNWIAQGAEWPAGETLRFRH